MADESDLDDELEGGDDTAFTGVDEAVEISPSRDGAAVVDTQPWHRGLGTLV